MPTKKMRVEVFDTDGNRYSISFEGQITRDKAVRLLDMVELLGGMPSSGSSSTANMLGAVGELSKYEKLKSVLEKHFPVIWFCSRDAQLTYEQEFKEPIGLSTVATYLARMANKRALLKAGAANRLRYKIVRSSLQAEIRQRMP
jgi:hypothetical protein